MENNKEFKKVMKELVRTNYATLDNSKLKVIMDHFYGPFYSYSSSTDSIHYLKPNVVAIFSSTGTGVEIIQGTSRLRDISREFPTFLKFIMGKYYKTLEHNEKAAYLIKDMTPLANYNRIRRLIKDFTTWVKETHKFASEVSDEFYIKFMCDLSDHSLLGDAYAKAVFQRNEKYHDQLKYKCIPSDMEYYEMIIKIFQRHTWNDQLTSRMFEKAIKNLLKEAKKREAWWLE